MEGRWVYQTSSFKGEMVFDSSARLLKFTNSQCSNQTADASVYIGTDPSFEVKIRQWNWCGDTSQYLKFAMNFTNEEKTRLEGIVDLHLDPSYKRYRIVMGKN
jgi:hypothetical protein